MPQAQPNPQVCKAIKDRGRLYLTVFRELTERYGEAEAVSIMRSVSHAIGVEAGKALAHLAPRDFAGMAEVFTKEPEATPYAPELRHLDETGLEVKMMACPLKQSWVEAGCSDEEICTLLHCASAFDHATLETAGFAFEHEMWSPGKEGCCHTKIWEKTKA